MPAEVTFDPAPLDIVHTDIVDDDSGKQGQAAGKQAGGLQRVDEHGQLFEIVFPGSVGLFHPFILHCLTV